MVAAAAVDTVAAAAVVAGRLAPDTELSGRPEALTIAGSEGSVVDFGACCHPVPGDPIMGYVSAGKGVVVHRANCRNVPELRKHPDRCLEVRWASITRSMFPVTLRVISENVPGSLANISASINEAGSNIETVAQPEANPEISTLLFNISVTNRDHMARVLRKLRRNPKVVRVHRVV